MCGVYVSDTGLQNILNIFVIVIYNVRMIENCSMFDFKGDNAH